MYLVINIQKRMERGLQTAAGDPKVRKLGGELAAEVGEEGRLRGWGRGTLLEQRWNPFPRVGTQFSSKNSSHYCLLPLHLWSVD